MSTCECGCGQKTRLAPQSSTRKGWVNGQPLRYVAGHNARLHVKWEMRDCGYEAPCRIWLGRKQEGGHGRLANRHALSLGETLTHRIAWVEENGPIPHGMHLHHLCKVPACGRVDHLKLVTPAEHAAFHPRPVRTHCPKGHEFTPENMIPSKVGARICRICRREHDRRVWIPRSQRRAS